MHLHVSTYWTSPDTNQILSLGYDMSGQLLCHKEASQAFKAQEVLLHE